VVNIKQKLPITATIIPVDDAYNLTLIIKMQESVNAKVKQVQNIRFLW
jgi:hypothetical protein